MARIVTLLFLFISFNTFAYRKFNFLPNSNSGQLVEHKYYTLKYIEYHEQAAWVAHKLTKECVHGRARRTDNFRSDPAVRTGSASTSDYKGSGYDRGHLVPAGDMKLNQTAMSESFYLSNISPQHPSMNRGIWRRLEEKIRKWVDADGDLYVITGPILKNPIGTIGKNKVTVPGSFYKIVLDYNYPKVKMIGFVIPNRETRRGYEDYTMSVDDIERLTGIDFFPALPDKLEKDLESSNSPWEWGL